MSSLVKQIRLVIIRFLYRLEGYCPDHYSLNRGYDTCPECRVEKARKRNAKANAKRAEKQERIGFLEMKLKELNGD